MLLENLSRSALVLGLLVLGAPAQAEAAADSYKVSDANGDGIVDRNEFNRRMVDVFYFLDKDKNGGLAAAEVNGTTAARFQAADRNGDGRLQMAEFLEARSRDFERADADGNGALSAQEAASLP